MGETIFLFRPERNQQKQLAQSVVAEGGLEALDRRWRLQAIEPCEVGE